MENIIKQTDANTKDIKTLSDAVIKLTILVEAYTNREETAAADPPQRKIFWDPDTKKYALKLGFVLCIVIVFALIGTNVIEQTKLTEILK
jgi:hypothetical protein